MEGNVIDLMNRRTRPFHPLRMTVITLQTPHYAAPVRDRGIGYYSGTSDLSIPPCATAPRKAKLKAHQRLIMRVKLAGLKLIRRALFGKPKPQRCDDFNLARLIYGCSLTPIKPNSWKGW